MHRRASSISGWTLHVVAPLRVAWSLGVFRLAIVPRVQRQLRGWEQTARAIPDPQLRRQALDSLRCKRGNAEAAAVFAILSPWRWRAAVVSVLVALQVLTDFLDTVSEVAVADPLRNSRALHEALVDAVRIKASGLDYYRHHPCCDSGVYVACLVAFCRARVQVLPACDTVRPLLVRAARRCGEGQSQTHAAIHQGPASLAAWARVLAEPTRYQWWEVAAAASSSVAVHALVAAAADRRTTRAEAERLDVTYYLTVGCLTVLLDNLVDRDDDAADGGHSYLRYYACASTAAARLVLIADHARDSMRGLRRCGRHRALLAGVLGFYLSAPGAHTAYARPIAARMLERAGTEVWLIIFAMRARRRVRRGSGYCS